MVPSLDIVIVNWNAGDQLRRCLVSIAAAVRDGFVLDRVVVVDNASCDDSLNGLECHSLPLELIRNPSNRGFGAASNQGARGSRADYLLFLNPDARLHADSLVAPLAFMERAENRDVGVCGIQLVDATGAVSRTCARFPSPGRLVVHALGADRLFPNRFPGLFMSDWAHDASRDVDHVMGAFYLVRRELFTRLGGFDERFFVYLEDLDLSCRVKRAGYRSHYLAGARAFHKGGGTSEQVKAARLFYFLHSRILYGYKHFGWWPATGVALVTGSAECLVRVAHAALRGSGSGVVETFRAYGMLWRQLYSVLGRTSGE